MQLFLIFPKVLRLPFYKTNLLFLDQFMLSEESHVFSMQKEESLLIQYDDDEDWAARRPWGRLPTKRVWLLRTYARKRAVPSQVLSQCRSKSRATVVGWPSSRLTRPTGPTRAGQLPPIARERQCPSQAAVDRCPTGPVMRVPIKNFLFYERPGWRRQWW